MTEEEARANLRKKNPAARKARVDALETRFTKLEAFIKVLIGNDDEKTAKAVSEFMGFKEPVDKKIEPVVEPEEIVEQPESPVEEKTKIKPVLGENFKAGESLDEEESTITEKEESEVDECQDETKEA